MTDVKLFSLKASHICISTVGVIPRMKQLLKDVPGVQLAISLHAPTQQLRNKIVPSSKSWSLNRIIQVSIDIKNTTINNKSILKGNR